MINLHLSDEAYRWYQDIEFVQGLAEEVGEDVVRYMQLADLAAKEHSFGQLARESMYAIAPFETEDRDEHNR